ncbi:MAG: hypothetical protein BA863_07520 [Desulfovibrio sp. S3730MH75]|nr:MAG: hypothetical protein BA863_07520 [Desulfovibrio sp. S3730MH75]
MSLKNEIENARQDIKTDHYPMSIGEWISMYKEGEIDIHPEFQRYYRWSNEQKTNLIESLVLGIPIPPIFVSQRDNGIWDVIDGLQRLSTIFQFMGILKNENGEKVEALRLNKTQYLPSFSDWAWVKDEGEEESEFDITLRLMIKRSKLNVSIVLKESDSDTKYELFQRLNTGGSSLSDQEVRNCILVMLNIQMHGWLTELSEYEPFRLSISLSDSSLAQKYDMDLALRFIIFHDIDENDLRGIGDINIFITEKMKRIAQDSTYNFTHVARCFRNTFDIIQTNMEGESLRRYNYDRSKFLGGFLLSAFEVVALGIGYNVKNHSENVSLDSIKEIFQNEEYTQWSGSGMTATRRLPHLIPLGRELFSNEA